LDNAKKVSAANDAEIRVMKNGPYLVSGNVPLYSMTIRCGENNVAAEWIIGERLKTPEKYLLCRCGKSQRKPFCDASHVRVNFDGTETSDNKPFDQLAKEFDGPTLKLKDVEMLCASARFCHRGGEIWEVIYKTDESWAKENVVRNAADCPSGRLVVVDKESGKTIEPFLEKSIGFIEDPAVGVDGPLWVRGGIPVFSVGGKVYEVRNRLTLCRCGKSTNKPFCDSSHYPEEDREI
jgi:CDGSH-type Zn-finger protein